MTNKILMAIGLGIEGKGGIERLCLYITREWQQQGLNPDIEILTTRGGKSTPWWGIDYLGSIGKLLLKCIRSDVDIFVAQVAKNASLFRKAILCFVARQFGVRTVVHLHGSGFDEHFQKYPILFRKLIQNMFKNADQVIVLGDFWREVMRDMVGVDDDKIVILPNAVPKPTAKAPIIKKGDTVKFLYLGVVNERKGAHILIEALKAVDGNWQCTIAGNGEIEKHQKMAQSLGDKVSFPGWVDTKAVHDLLSTHHVLVLPSRAENLPMAILEAMGAGLAIVSSRIAAIPEVVTDNGILLEPQNVNDLKDALQGIVNDEGKLQQMQKNSLKNFGENFIMDGYVQRFQKVVVGG